MKLEIQMDSPNTYVLSRSKARLSKVRTSQFWIPRIGPKPQFLDLDLAQDRSYTNAERKTRSANFKMLSTSSNRIKLNLMKTSPNVNLQPLSRNSPPKKPKIKNH